MWRRTLPLVIAVFATALAGAAASRARSSAPSRAERPYAATFPAGPGRTIAERACTVCHSPMLTLQQAKDSTAWEKTLTQMEKWGAPTLTPAERDTLRRWLLEQWGPRAR